MTARLVWLACLLFPLLPAVGDSAFHSTVKLTGCRCGLSRFTADRYTLGISHLDIPTQRTVVGWGLKSFDVNLSAYRRDNGSTASQIALGLRVVRQ